MRLSCLPSLREAEDGMNCSQFVYWDCDLMHSCWYQYKRGFLGLGLLFHAWLEKEGQRVAYVLEKAFIYFWVRPFVIYLYSFSLP